jgi:peptide/nickel transport system permease protein
VNRYLAKRLLQGLFVLWAAYTLSFLILYLLPGDAAAIQAGGAENGGVDPELGERLRAEYGLDRPLWEQYLTALGRALTLDFGSSTQSGTAATATVAAVLPQTFALAATALPLAVVFGVALAVASTFAKWRWLRHALSALPPLGVSVPGFWLGLLLLQFFSFRLQLFPSMGNEGWASLVLPAVALAIPTGAFIAQILARSLRQTLEQPYIELVRAKGASSARVHFGHALQNAVIPTLTLTGVLVGQLLAGTVVTETVFSRIGVGRLVVSAVNSRDIPVVQTIVVFAALVFVLTSLVVDLLYPLVDRRISVAGPSLVSA